MSKQPDILPCDALPRPLDDTPPTPEQYARFYALAKQVFDEAPWEYFVESQIVAVDREDGETDFVSVMGALGTHFAVAVYPTIACLDRFMTLDQLPQNEASDLFFEIPQLQLVFGSKTQLFPGERETIEASGIRFKNGKWPSAQAFVPGYYPWKAGAKGLKSLCDALEQLLAVLRNQTKIPFFQEQAEKFVTRFRENGEWHTAMRKQTIKAKRYAFEIPQDLLVQAKALPVRMMCMEADCFPMQIQFGKKGERAVCPRQMLLVDRVSHFLFSPDILTPEKGKEWSFIQSIVECLRQLVKLGFRPASFAFARESTADWLEPLCRLLDARLDTSPCNALNECRHEMESLFLSR